MKLLNFFVNINFKKRVILSIFATSMTILIIVSIFNFYYSVKTISHLTKNNFYSIVNKTTQIADERLNTIQKSSLNMNLDTDLYNIFSGNDRESDNILSKDRTITRIIQRYIQEKQGISSVLLSTSYYIFGSILTNIPRENQLSESSIERLARNDQGVFSWIPNYSYKDSYKTTIRNKKTTGTECIFSGARQMNLTYEFNSIYKPLDSKYEKPIFIANYDYNFFDDLLNNSLPVEKCIYMVINDNNEVIYHSDPMMIGKSLKYSWLNTIKKNGSLNNVVKLENIDYFVFAKKSDVTNWYTISLAPYNQAILQMKHGIFLDFCFVAVFVILIAIGTGYVFANQITTPITDLIKAIQKSSKGDFTVQLSSSKTTEVNQLINAYNNMNKKIDQLIDQISESRIRENNAAFAALMNQLNPHFLYNTLNIINWMAIENNEDEISDMIVSLSQILQYSSHTENKVVKFSEDLDWIKKYIKIMKIRYNTFEVIYDIDDRLFDIIVPKLFTQPFIENIFVHAFKNLKSDGLIHIKGNIFENFCVFKIIDNGCGMSQRILQQIAEENTNKLGIVNVVNRIQILYGQEYKIKIDSQIEKGTEITINLPLNY